MKFRFSSVPYIVWSVIFVVVPLILVAVFGLSTSDGQFTFANVAKVSDYTAVFVRSIWLSLVATAICLVIAYPLGFIMSRYNANNQRTLVMLVMLPMWMNFLLRTYAWMSILENNGLLNQLFQQIGLIDLYNQIAMHFASDPAAYVPIDHFQMIGTQGAVVLGMVYNYLPFMIMPIYTVIDKIDHRVIEAAQDLGANTANVFRRVIFPLSVPGIISGITMVFVPALTTFVISDLLGGGKILLIGNVIEQSFKQNSNWHVGSGLSMVLMVFIIASMALVAKYDKEGEGSSF